MNETDGVGQGRVESNAPDLLARLLEYVEEQAKEIDPRVFRLQKAEFLKRRKNLTGLPGVEFDVQTEGDHVWLRVRRLHAGKPPELAERLRERIRVGDDPEGPKPAIDEAALQAHLAKAAVTSSEDLKELERAARDTLAAQLANYTPLWEAWAEAEKPRRRAIELYAELFAIKHRAESEETTKPIELVWGVGIATWQLTWQEANRTTKVEFEYPLLTQQVEVVLEDGSMDLCLRPRDTRTLYEGDAFAVCQVRGAAEVARTVDEQLRQREERPVTPFDPGSFSEVLKLVAGMLDGRGSYLDLSDVVPPNPTDRLVVTNAWALFARPRSNNYLLDDLRRLKKRIVEGCDIPDGPRALVSVPSDEVVPFASLSFRGLSSSGGGGQGATQELYFPLPYNQEQVTIVQHLEQAEGVTVQGPPGTGKTHTIANIICHYLATGKRVLVTSKGEPALRVLQSKIPEEIRPLTVALLASDREGLRQFEGAINQIQATVSQLNPEVTRQEVSNKRSQIDRAHAELARIDRRIDEVALAHLADVEVEGRTMRSQELAELVMTGSTEHAWFDDQVGLAPEHAPPLSEEEAARLRQTRRELGPDLVYFSARVVAVDDLLEPADVARTHEALQRAGHIDRQVQEGTLLALRTSSEETLEAAQDLLARVDAACERIAELDALGEPWTHQLRAKLRIAAFRSESDALQALFDEVEALSGERAAFLRRPVELPLEAHTTPKVAEAIARAGETGKPFGVISFGGGGAKELLARVRVAGLPPTTTDAWQHVGRYLALHQRVLVFSARWNEVAPALGVPRAEGGVSELRRIETIALAARKAQELTASHEPDLVQRANTVFMQAPVSQLRGALDDLLAVRTHLMAHLSKADLALAASQRSTLQAKLGGTTGPVSEALTELVDHDLGREDVTAEDIGARYAKLLSELKRVQGLRHALGFVREAASRIERAGATRLATRIRNICAPAYGDDPTFPTSWRHAWAWARAKGHLETIEARHELAKLSARRRDLEAALSRLYEEMVARAAWLETKQRASPRVLQALQGYATAIRRIGHGTGSNATRYRRDAKHHMTSAADAVPCWIMSHAKVSESAPAEIGAFDLVVVDEASQSDLWALPAVLRGKKVLVVGDDKQVSPDGGFISAKRIQDLRDRFLVGQPFKEDMTPEKSLYDLAARVFASQQVMLREHFRCVPPIIAYSNKTFYKGAVQPIRIPKATERLDPPLVDVFLEDGCRNERNSNDEEAHFIASEIFALLADERFAGRTIGVVTLLGPEQAKVIDQKVRQRCNSAELMRRQFECGDARTFQGSERDIIFLSMVVDARECKALSGNGPEQRFNVAASRARDRMYLVRSVRMEDLSDKDLRLSLLKHFSKPIVTDKDEVLSLLQRCESGFEREVYSALADRGYRVIPQVQTGAYRIDMVVEGAGDARLAIECDGDAFHGPDRWPHDMARQRVLERAGWTFWRCFASTWQLHKEELLHELIGRLSAMGIEPLGAMPRIPQLVELRQVSRGHQSAHYETNEAKPLMALSLEGEH